MLYFVLLKDSAHYEDQGLTEIDYSNVWLASRLGRWPPKRICEAVRYLQPSRL